MAEARFPAMRWGAGGRFVAAVVAVFVAATLLAGCSDGEASEPGATVPETLPETTTTTIDVTVVPDEITVAYADAVMDELDSLLGEAIRELVRARGPNERFYNLLNAVYDDGEFEDQQSVYGEIAAQDFAGMRTRPGDPLTEVLTILSSRRECMLLDVRRDFGPFLDSPKGDDVEGFVVLSAKQADSDPAGLNPTRWTLTFDGDTLDREPPGERC